MMPSIEPVLELQVHYFEYTDPLVLATDQPSLYGETVGRNLVAFTNEEGDVVGVTLEHAAELLRPYLFPQEFDAKQEPKIGDHEAKRRRGIVPKPDFARVSPGPRFLDMAGGRP